MRDCSMRRHSGCCPFPQARPTDWGNYIGHDGTWFPDGQRILFAKDHDLYVATANGTEPKKFASLPGFADLAPLVARRFTFAHITG